jgi:serine/threonine protein kinase
MSDALRCPRCQNPIPADAPDGLCPVCLLGAGQVSDTRTLPNPGGGRFVSPLPAELAPDFPQLEILEIIGQGGMGTVYKARQRHLDRIVALKILRPDLSTQPAFAERFAREARALARLSHPHLVTVHDFGQSGRWFWIIMEHVDGANLRQILAGGRFTQRQALEIIPQLCEALQYAHDRGIVHRDIKPENILLDGGGQVKVADFGLAKLIMADASERSLTASRDVVGTAHYMAPEQIEHSRDVDHRADIYSMGVVFYEMLTGGLPLGRFEAPSKTTTSSPGLDPVVMRTLEKDPGQRYQQASEVKSAVQSFELPGITAAAQPATTPAPSPDPPAAHSSELEGPILLITGGLLAVTGLLKLPASMNSSEQVVAHILIAAIGGLIFWGGLQAMKATGDHRWVAPAKILGAVAIPFAFQVDDHLGWALIGISIFWFRRYRKHERAMVSAGAPHAQAQASSPVQAQPLRTSPPATQAATIPGVATEAATVVRTLAGDHRVRRWLWLAVVILALICGVELLTDLHGQSTHNVHVWMVWAGLIPLALILLPRRREPLAPTLAQHGLVSVAVHGTLRLLGILILSATMLLCVGALLLAKFAPDDLQRLLSHVSIEFDHTAHDSHSHDF